MKKQPIHWVEDAAEMNRQIRRISKHVGGLHTELEIGSSAPWSAELANWLRLAADKLDELDPK